MIPHYRELDAAVAGDALLDIPFRVGNPRDRTGPFDFGEQDTCRLHLKSVPFDFNSEDIKFGLYAGKYGEKYVVVLLEVSGEIAGVDRFDTIEELKQNWQLD